VNGRKYKVASDDTLRYLGNSLISELAAEIKAKSEVDPAEEKN